MSMREMAGKAIAITLGLVISAGLCSLSCAQTPTETPTITPTPTEIPTIMPPPPPVGSYAYVTNNGSEQVSSSIISRIDTLTYAVDTIGVGFSPSGIDITPDGAYVLVANYDSNTVSVVHTGSAREIKQINVGVHPLGVVIDHKGQYAYVTNKTENSVETNGTVSVIDLAQMTVVGEIEVGKLPTVGIGISSDNTLIAVPNFNSNTVSLIRKGADPSWGVAQTISTAFGPLDTKFYPGEPGIDADRLLYVACWGAVVDSQVAVYDLDNGGAVVAKYYTDVNTGILKPTPWGNFPSSAINFHPYENRFFVSNNADDRVIAVSPWDNDRDKRGNVKTGAGPAYGDFTPDGSRFFVPCFSSSEAMHSGYVDVIDSGTMTKLASVPVGMSPAMVVISNGVIAPYAEEKYGVNLYAGPRIFTPGTDNITLDWTIKPLREWVGARVDISLNVWVYLGGFNYLYYTFYPGLRPVSLPRQDINAMPVLLGNYPLESLASGTLTFPTDGIPPGWSIQFEVLIRYPGGAIFTRGNWVTSETEKMASRRHAGAGK